MEEHKRKLIVFPVTRFYIREDCRPKEGSLCAQQISISLSGLLSEFRTFQIYRQKSTNIYVYMHPYQKHSFVGVLFRWLQTGNMRDFPTGEGFVVLFSRKMPRWPRSAFVGCLQRRTGMSSATVSWLAVSEERFFLKRCTR